MSNRPLSLTHRPQRHAWAAMSPAHHLRAALLARRLRSCGLTVERRGCSLRITGGGVAEVRSRVYRGGVPLVGVLSTIFHDEHLFADSPAGFATLVASHLLPSPAAQPSPPRHRAHQRECPCTPSPR